ncbi:hypothetical protein [Pseudomonas sp.]|uniref:hypothetical protein n=1 Tax=Pseudomonas sp. TaxID=306 RepID=UPI003D0EAEC5
MKSADVCLKLEVGRLVLSPIKSDLGESFFDFDIFCELIGRYRGFLPDRFFCRFYLGDIEKLILYCETHVRNAMSGVYESCTYFPLEGDLQIKLSSGEVVDFSDGYFSIRILFNCGQESEFSSNAYFGFETVVTLVDLASFCDGLKWLACKG